MGNLSFVKIKDRSTALFAVPVPSRRGVALLLFAARAKGRGSRWWSPTLALAGSPLRAFIDSLRRVAEGGESAAFKSRKSGLFVVVRRRDAGYILLLGSGSTVFASLRMSRGDLQRATSLLEAAVRWPPNQLPPSLTWEVKEEIFGPHAG